MPTTVGEVIYFLGWVNYLRGFLPKTPIADVLRNKKQAVQFQGSLYSTSSVGTGNSRSFRRNRRETHHLFNSRTTRLAQAVHASHGCQHSGTRVCSHAGRGAPVGLASKRLSRSEERLSSNDREVLGGVVRAGERHDLSQYHRFTWARTARR